MTIVDRPKAGSLASLLPSDVDEMLQIRVFECEALNVGPTPSILRSSVGGFLLSHLPGIIDRSRGRIVRLLQPDNLVQYDSSRLREMLIRTSLIVKMSPFCVLKILGSNDNVAGLG